MPKASPIQASFNAGEVSPRLESRVQFDARAHGVKTLENFACVVQGAAVSRPGTRHLGTISANASGNVMLIPFVFSTTDTYVLEMSAETLRIWKDGVLQEVGPAGGSVYEIATPYQGRAFFDLDGTPKLQWAQSADVMFFAHPEFPPIALYRVPVTPSSSSTEEGYIWTFYVNGSLTGDQSIASFTALDFGRLHSNGPYLDTQVAQNTITPSAATGTITLDAITSMGWVASDVGRQMRLLDPVSGEWTWGYIETVVDPTEVTFTIVGPDLSGTTDIVTYAFGAWYSGSYPSTILFHENRLWYGGAAGTPTRVDASRTGDYRNFSPSDADETVLDDHAISVTILSNQANLVEWLLDDERGLVIGTAAGPWLLYSTDDTAGLTPSTVAAKRVAGDGCASTRAIRVGKQILFVQRALQKVRELGYSLDDDALRADDVTKLAEHITYPGVTAMFHQPEPHGLVWCMRDDGALLGYTSSRVDRVAGWHRHLLGGSYIGSHPNTFLGTVNIAHGFVMHACVIPSTTGDDLYLLVKRATVGITVEVLTDFFRDTDAQEDAFCVDCGVTYDSTPATTITGLSHLNGKTVSILADGKALAQQVVSGGQVILEDAASTVQVGLPYTPTLQTLRIEAGAADGTAQGKIKHITQVIFRFLRTAAAWVGYDSDHMDEVPFTTTGDDMDDPPALYDGDKIVEWDAGHETDGYVRIEQREPYPMTVLAVMPRVTTEDG